MALLTSTFSATHLQGNHKSLVLIVLENAKENRTSKNTTSIKVKKSFSYSSH